MELPFGILSSFCAEPHLPGYVKCAAQQLQVLPAELCYTP